jgi:hypothetical protein
MIDDVLVELIELIDPSLYARKREVENGFTYNYEGILGNAYVSCMRLGCLMLLNLFDISYFKFA